MTASSRIIWDWGTAYDFFISLEVLNEPAKFGVRGSWAAGVRARLQATDRDMLDQSRQLFHVPFHWLYALPEPKNGTTVMWALEQLPPEQRLPALALAPCYPCSDASDLLKTVADRGVWTDSEREALRGALHCDDAPAPTEEKITITLDWWSRAAEFGERYLAALRAYHSGFFAEEEQRIQPALEEALVRAQRLAAQSTLADLLEDLSQGVRFGELPETGQMILVPSYWTTPLVLLGEAADDIRLVAFGARPADASLVPGEVVPDALLRVLKALSDPTRLRMLHYLAKEPQPPAQLARRLRLRAPTVTHHLKTLRLAGLVQMTVGQGTDAKSYSARKEAIAAACDNLKSFLDGE
jgi:DNA-binding transcriptional ArsR family regulator